MVIVTERSQNSGQSPLSDTPDENVQRDAQHYRNFLEQLLDMLGTRDEATVSRMVTLIRSGASEQEILAMMARSSEEGSRTGQTDNSGRENGQRQG